jgi:hypothetical protein
LGATLSATSGVTTAGALLEHCAPSPWGFITAVLDGCGLITAVPRWISFSALRFTPNPAVQRLRLHALRFSALWPLRCLNGPDTTRSSFSGGGIVCVLGIEQQHGGLCAIIVSVSLDFSGLSTGHSGHRVRPRLQTTEITAFAPSKPTFPLIRSAGPSCSASASPHRP